MGKYIWPRDVSDATKWYLSVLITFYHGATVEEMLTELKKDTSSYSKLPHDTLRRRLYRLHEQGFVEKHGKGSSSRYEIRKKGIERLENLTLRTNSAPRSWDGRWRIVIFDVPEETRLARDHIRRLLKELGFRQLQRSVWIHPFPVLDQFKKIQAAYDIYEDLQLIETHEFRPPQKLIDHFKKTYPKIIK